MQILAAIAGVVLIIGILTDSFESIVLPRRVSRRFRLSRFFYMVTWLAWSAIARKMRPGNRREYYLSYFGQLSLILLLLVWAPILVFAVALWHWRLAFTFIAPPNHATLWTYLSMIRTTFFT